MGTLTVPSLISEVRAGLGNRVDPALTDTRIINSMNFAQNRLARWFSFREMKQILVATNVYTGNEAVDKYLPLPTTLKVIHSIVLQDGANSRKLTEKPWRMFDSNVPLVEYVAASWPVYYTRFTPYVAMLFPAPQQAFTWFLRATVWPNPLVATNTNQVSDFEFKDDILINWTLEYLFRSLGRQDLAADYENIGDRLAEDAVKYETDQPDMDISQDSMGNAIDYSGQYWANPWSVATPDS